MAFFDNGLIPPREDKFYSEHIAIKREDKAGTLSPLAGTDKFISNKNVNCELKTAEKQVLEKAKEI
jgi:hypothetical protein